MGRKLRTGFRAASKVQERELVEKARTLRSHPEVLIPRCLEESCPRCPFDSLLSRLQRIAAFSEEERRLERFARGGPPLARAYAATLLLAVQQKAPYLAPAKTPFGTVHYALRGKARREELVGVQYYDIPELRLLTVGGFARKKGYHVYSLEDEMVTSCREDRPPEAFVSQVVSRVPAGLHKEGEEFLCPHAAKETSVVVHWKGSGKRIVMCRRCSPQRGNFVTLAGSRMTVPSLQDSFDLSLRVRMSCSQEACSISGDHPLSGEKVDDYVSGKLDEADLIEAEATRLVERLAREGGLFVIGDACFEDDGEAFLKKLRVQEELTPFLREILSELSGGLVLTDGTSAKLVEELPNEERLRLFSELVGEESRAEELLKEWEEGDKGLDTILEQAILARKDVTALADIPSWDSLPPGARLVDSVVRCYKTKGKAEASLLASKGLEGGATQKILALSLLKALDSAAGKEWMFRPEEKELAEHLSSKVEALLEIEGGKYGRHLQEILTASGSGEVIPD